ncbi:MAG: DegT/DnrJ/EryC1/StrS family aminotransferase, partial [Ignavibacteria bacterium]|nr:DegT/DnrJ/EryC1/StrS family aminotransferase [Ignavibacteria bacterium]
MRVPFVDLHAQYLSIKDEIDNSIQSVINDTAFIGGKYVKEFENNFADSYGVKHCIGVANGTDAIYIILKMLGIGPGDEVITAANTWISTSETITQTGAKPVFIDIDEKYYTINENLIESKITSKTKAIIPVHLYGQVCNIEKIQTICKKHNLFLIEDCAQSHFSSLENKLAGTSGIASSFSFYPGKNLGAYGDAGCIITNDDTLAKKIRMFANHGSLIKHEHDIEGINSRLDGLQAAILNTKLPHLDNWINKRIFNAQLYTKLLNG